MTPNFSLSQPRAARRILQGAVVAVALVSLAGCASGPRNPRDPLEPFNRKMMEFNEGLDAVALKPAATVYRRVLPPLVRTGVSNFFANIGDAWTMVNSLLQFRFQDAGESLARLQINTMFGLGGIIDVASELNIERHREDFGQTLGRWGVASGPYIVLPFFGPSTLRDTLALPIDRKYDPLHEVKGWDARYTFYTLRAVDSRSNLLRVGNVIEEAALDKYSFTREAHMQRRRAEIIDDKTSDTAGQEPKADGTPAAAPGAPASAPRKP
ncbi:MAG TPA: VacJ family lipoprotein [Ramlibacter sp.]|nr:VacJ family lipoprotein [Ramlibacter sp.]